MWSVPYTSQPFVVPWAIISSFCIMIFYCVVQITIWMACPLLHSFFSNKGVNFLNSEWYLIDLNFGFLIFYNHLQCLITNLYITTVADVLGCSSCSLLPCCFLPVIWVECAFMSGHCLATCRAPALSNWDNFSHASRQYPWLLVGQAVTSAVSVSRGWCLSKSTNW